MAAKMGALLVLEVARWGSDETHWADDEGRNLHVLPTVKPKGIRSSSNDGAGEDRGSETQPSQRTGR